jgi:HEAT repeat protein
MNTFPPDVNELVRLLRNGSPDDPDTEWKAAIALADVTEPEARVRSQIALLNVLTDGRSHALTRSHAAESLGRLGDANPLVVSGLILALNDPYRLVRSYAAGALSVLGSTEGVVEALLRVLEGDDFYGARAAAAEAAASVANRSRDENLRRRVRALLTERRAIEIASGQRGIERVIREIDDALNGVLAE